MLVVAIAVFAAFAASAFAGEFKLDGSYRLYGISTDTGVTGTDADESQYFTHRFRLPFSWKVNDNVTAFLRTDWAEQNRNGNYWGTESLYGGNSHNGGGAMQVDYAWVKISKPVFDLTVGMQEVWLGEGSLFDSDQEGFTLDLKLDPVTITFAYGKLNEGAANILDATGHKIGGGASLNDDGNNADADTYAAQIKYTGKDWYIGALYAMAIDRSAAFDEKKIGYGLFGNATIGAVTIKGELDIFDGDASLTEKYDGMNLWADLSYNVSDALILGVAGYYAKGNNSATKTQLTSVSATGWSFATFDYRGAMELEYGYDVFGTALDASAFDPAPDSGIQAIKGYASYKATDALTLHAVIGYAVPDENVTLNSQTYLIGSLDYEWIPNVTLSIGAAYVGVDYSDNTNDDPLIQYVARLFVKF